MILGNFITPINYSGMYFGLFDTLKPLLLGDNPNVSLSFLLGWGVTITAGLMSYPIGRSTDHLILTLTSALQTPSGGA